MGDPCHSTSPSHSTHDKSQGTSLRENSSSQDQKSVGNGGQIREQEAMPCVSSSATSDSERCDSTMQGFVLFCFV